MRFVGESEEEALSRGLAELHGVIAERGWAVRTVMAGPEEGDDVKFRYTIGLTALAHPEVIIVGMPAEHAATFSSMIGGEVQRGGQFGYGAVTREFASDESPAVFIRAVETERLSAVAELSGRTQPDDCRGRTGIAIRPRLSRCCFAPRRTSSAPRRTASSQNGGAPGQ